MKIIVYCEFLSFFVDLREILRKYCYIFLIIILIAILWINYVNNSTFLKNMENNMQMSGHILLYWHKSNVDIFRSQVMRLNGS